MSGKKHRIVIIDDDVDLLATASRLLELEGFEVVTHRRAFNSTNLVAQLRPDLVLLDVNMPFLSGDNLFRLFKEDSRLAGVPVVFFSSNDEGSLRRMVQEMGAKGYITKSELSGDKIRRFLPAAVGTTGG